MVNLSQHAIRRTQQSGANRFLVDLIIQNADVEIPVGSNCSLLRVHQRTAAKLNLDDRLARYGVIWSDDNDQVVTILPLCEGRRGSRYRRTH